MCERVCVKFYGKQETDIQIHTDEQQNKAEKEHSLAEGNDLYSHDVYCVVRVRFLT